MFLALHWVFFLPYVIQKILLLSLIGKVLLLCFLGSEMHIFFHVDDPQTRVHLITSEVGSPLPKAVIKYMYRREGGILHFIDK